MRALALPSHVDRELPLDGEEAYPKGQCGLRIGADSTALEFPRPVARARRPRRRPHAVDPELIRRTEEGVDVSGKGVFGFPHSPPDPLVLPSMAGRKRAGPGYLSLVHSVSRGCSADLGAFELDACGDPCEPANGYTGAPPSRRGAPTGRS